MQPAAAAERSIGGGLAIRAASCKARQAEGMDALTEVQSVGLLGGMAAANTESEHRWCSSRGGCSLLTASAAVQEAAAAERSIGGSLAIRAASCKARQAEGKGARSKR